jgi:hypothetical protein
MNLANIKAVFTSKLGRQALVAQKHSPKILFIAGVVGVGATVVLSCKATLKLEEILEDAEQTKDGIENLQHEDYTDIDRKKDMTLLYTKTAIKVAKLYALPAAVGVVSIAALTGSHAILSKRNAAVTAAYAALEKGFKEYRKRVIDEYGEDKDREFRYGSFVETKLSEDTENGTVIQDVKVLGGKNASIYARFFDETNPNWNRSPNYNQMFIQCQQNYANDKLRAQGHLFLNEVYDMLGIPRSKEGSVVGWISGGEGDNYVDFGIFRDGYYTGTEFVNGDERSILLDFNVDGVIYDKI